MSPWGGDQPRPHEDVLTQASEPSQTHTECQDNSVCPYFPSIFVFFEAEHGVQNRVFLQPR
jgi:hypothetical protein